MKNLVFFLFLLNVSLSAHSQNIDNSTRKNTILIATHIEPPLVYIEDEAFRGSNVEVAHLLAHRMNKTAEFIYCPFARCLAMTRDGIADMMVSIIKTEERQQYFSYLERPFRSKITPVRFYIAKDSDFTIENYEDLKDLRIGVLRGASYFKRFSDDKTLSKVEVSSHTQLIEMLLKKRIDVFLGRELSIKPRVPQKVYENEMKKTPYIHTHQINSYIAISKKSPLNNELDAFSKALNVMLDSGEIENTLANFE